MAFYSGEDTVEVKVHADGRNFRLSAERGIGFQFENIIDPIDYATESEIDRQLMKLAIGDLWKSYEFSTSDNLTKHVSVFVIPSTKIPRGNKALQMDAGVSRYSIPNALAAI